jgi:hypothetical protein
VSWLTDPLPILLALGWVVRAPLVSRDEGHETITRTAWEGLLLAPEQQDALIRGVRAPDVSLAGFLISALPFAQRRHALRAWSGTTTPAAVREVCEFLVATHLRALSLPDGPRRWATFGEVLHCLQDSYSPAHTDRVGGRIVQMRHWGPLDPLRGREEHGFPSDRRDSAWMNGELTEEARGAVEASRRYLETAIRRVESLEAFLDQHVRDSSEGA